MTLNFNDFITVSQLAEQEKTTRRTVYRWLESDDPPPHQQAPDGRYYINKEALKAWKRPDKGRKPKMKGEQ